MNRTAADSATLISKLGAASEIKPTAIGQVLTLNLGVQVISCSTDERGRRQSTENQLVSRHLLRSTRHPGWSRTTPSRFGDIQRTYEKDGQQLFISELVAEELDLLNDVKESEVLLIPIELVPGGLQRRWVSPMLWHMHRSRSPAGG